jgi:hypothetical protein
MSRSRMNDHHVQDDELIRYADGEMPARRVREIRFHLEACWQCRAGLEELQKVIGDCVRYRKDLLHVYLPSPPARWGDIYQGFAEIDASRNDVPLFLRIRESLRLRLNATRLYATPRWATAALAIILAGVLSVELLRTPSVQAAELLRKAAVAADARPVKPRLIQIKTNKHQITRRLNSAVSASSTEAATEIQAMFRAARYNWNDPLSVRSYQDWRDGLADKRDDVTTVTDQTPDQSVYRIHTAAATGEIAQATLTLRVLDLQPVHERFEFRDREWMEISELPDEAAPAPDSASAALAGNPRTASARPQVAPVSGLARTSGPTAGEELQVFAALHRLGADLGDPIEVTRERSRIVVAGVGIAPERQEQIHKVLDAVPNVVVRFSEPAAAASPYAQPAAPAAPAKSVSQQFQSRIEQQIGGRQNFEQFSSQLLDMADAMMSRAYALRRLADRFSKDLEASLSPADRQVLRNLNREHTTTIKQQAAQMESLLKPVLVPLGGGSSAGGTGSGIHSVSWQPATEELFQNARNVETLLAVMLGVTPGDSNAQLPSEVLLGVAQLRAIADAYEQLAVQEPGGK